MTEPASTDWTAAAVLNSAKSRSARVRSGRRSNNVSIAAFVLVLTRVQPAYSASVSIRATASACRVRTTFQRMNMAATYP